MLALAVAVAMNVLLWTLAYIALSRRASWPFMQYYALAKVVDDVLAELDGDLEAMYSRIGRRSVPPEQLLKATVLMARYSIRSERAFCERLNYDLLFRWFWTCPSTPGPSTPRPSRRTASAS
jgi:transposase